jgi:DNA-binding MurR/RpiR family transcriptional regulator
MPSNASNVLSADTAFAQSPLGKQLRGLLNDVATTGANRAIAEQLLRNPVRATAWGIEELAAQAQTSTASLSRFARTMGFDGFAGLRDAMAQTLQGMLQPVEKLRDAMTRADSGSSAVLQSLEAGLNNVRQSSTSLDEVQVTRIAKQLAKARSVYTMGFGISSHLAAMLALDLQPFCTQLVNIVEFGGTEVAAGRLMNIGKGDVLIVISFPRYARDVLQLSDYARGRGAHVVAITDSMASPLVPLADDVLLATAHHPIISSSSVAAVLVIEALVSQLMTSRKESIGEAGRLTEAISEYLYSPETNGKGGKSARYKR